MKKKVKRNRVGMQEAQAETERNCDGRVQKKLAQSEIQVTPAQSEIESHAGELANDPESVDAGVEQQNLVEDRQMRRPGRLEPAQIHGKPKRDEHEEIAPDALLLGIGAAGPIQDGRKDDRKQRVQNQPRPAKSSGGDCDDSVRKAKERRSQ